MSDLAGLVGKQVFRLGDTGQIVTAIQLRLRDLGYKLSGTGYFGTQTDAAVEAFQRHAGLKVDGDVGSTTAKALDATVIIAGGTLHPPAMPSVPVGDVDRVLWLDISIANIGLKEAPGSADNQELVRDIREVAGDYFHDSTPWCAGWVSFCLARSGQKPSKLPLWALSYADDWGVKLAGPAVGAIAVKHRAGGGHVTFVAGKTANGRLACCGGNQNDMVNISGYPEDVFDGFYWPKGVELPKLIGLAHLPVVNAAGGVVREA